MNKSNSNPGNEYVNELLTYTSDLVYRLGAYKINNSKSLKSELSLNGISFWDIFSVELAHSFLPTIIEKNKKSNIFFSYLKSSLRFYKNKMADFLFRKFNNQELAALPNKRTLLFLGFSPRMYRDTLKPIVDLLSSKGDFNIVILYDRKRVEGGSRNTRACKYESIWDHWNPIISRGISSLRRDIDKVHINFSQNKSIKKMLEELVSNPLKVKNLEIIFDEFFNSYVRGFVPRAVLARAILNKYKPSLVVTPDMADSRTRVYSSLSKELDIPSLDIQYALMGNEGLWAFFNSDLVAAWGPSSKTIMMREGVPEDKIVLTGSPRFDYQTFSSNSRLNNLKERYSEHGEKVIILLASTYHPKSHKNYPHTKALNLMKLAISEAIHLNSNLVLIVKPHPHEDFEQTKKFFRNSKNIIFIDKDLDIRDYIHICDVFVSFGSTATMDALAAEKLTICPVFPDWGFSKFYEDSGAVLTPKSKEELKNIFSKLSDGSGLDLRQAVESGRNSFIANHLFTANGNSSERIKNLIYEMVG
jgi:hypothetical protein